MLILPSGGSEGTGSICYDGEGKSARVENGGIKTSSYDADLHHHIYSHSITKRLQ